MVLSILTVESKRLLLERMQDIHQQMIGDIGEDTDTLPFTQEITSFTQSKR